MPKRASPQTEVMMSDAITGGPGRSPPAQPSRVWRGLGCREPLLVAARAIGAEYASPAQSSEHGDTASGVCVVDVRGPLEHHHDSCYDSFHDVADRVSAALERQDVRAVIMRIDSPGGVASGMASTSRAIRAKADSLGKLIFAYADEQACSAAYGLACAADEIWGPPTGEIGSVGVILPVVDQTAANAASGIRVELIVTGERKGDGHPDKPIDDAALVALQGRVDAIGRDFFALVADARGMTTEAVAGLQAGVFVGQEAVDAGLSDGVCDWQEFFSIVSSAVSESAQIVDKPLKSASTKSVLNGLGTSRRKAVDMARNKGLALAQAKNRAVSAIDAAATIVDLKARAEAVRAAVEGVVSASSKFYKKTIKVEETIEDDSEKKDDLDKKSEEDDAEDDKPESVDDDGDDGEDDAEDAEKDGEDDGEDDDKKDDDKKDDEKPEEKKGKRASVIGRLRAITGSHHRADLLGKLDAMALKAKLYDQTAAHAGKREVSDQASAVDRLVKRALEEGKVRPADKAMLTELRAYGADSPRRLSAFVDAMPRLVRTMGQGPVAAAVEIDGAPSHTEMLSAQARSVIESVARTTGKTIDAATADYVAAYNRASGR